MPIKLIQHYPYPEFSENKYSVWKQTKFFFAPEAFFGDFKWTAHIQNDQTMACILERTEVS